MLPSSCPPMSQLCFLWAAQKTVARSLAPSPQTAPESRAQTGAEWEQVNAPHPTPTPPRKQQSSTY